MPSVFFKIGPTDLTAYEDIQSHDVNREDVYDIWTDGNRIDHRVVVRTRVSGTIKLGFSDAAAFASFVALLRSARSAEGFYTVTAYCSNTGTLETFEAYLDVVGADKWDLKNGHSWQVAKVKITGR